MTATFRIARSARRDLQEISDFWTSESGEELALRVIAGIIEAGKWRTRSGEGLARRHKVEKINQASRSFPNRDCEGAARYRSQNDRNIPLTSNPRL
jgi:hypothetical protein